MRSTIAYKIRFFLLSTIVFNLIIFLIYFFFVLRLGINDLISIAEKQFSFQCLNLTEIVVLKEFWRKNEDF